MLIKTVMQGALAALLVAGAAAAYAAASGPEPQPPEAAASTAGASDLTGKTGIRGLLERFAGEDEDEAETEREGRRAPIAAGIGAEGKFERKGDR